MAISNHISRGFLLGLLLAQIPGAQAGPREQATRLFDRLASAPLTLTDARRAQMEALITQGNLIGAAQIATADDRFYNLTLKTWATPMSNRDEDWQVAQRSNSIHYLTDFAAMVIGSVRDDRSAQELLNGDFTYAVTDITNPSIPAYQPLDPDMNNHYQMLEQYGVNLREKLVRITPQRPDFSDSAGLITSQAWGYQHFRDGTNRRPIHYAMREFLCTDIEALRDANYPTTRIRRDVDRAPGGDATVFATTCKTCHGGMDGLAGAFAYYDRAYIPTPQPSAAPLPTGYFPGYQLTRTPNPVFPTSTSPVSKMNKNGNIFPAGYVTINDSWVNIFASSQTSTNIAMGWPANMTSGNGIRSLGTMLANTRGFPVCMAKRVFRKVCAREALPVENATINTLADQFVSGGYKLKSLFENTAILPTCLGN